MCHFQNQASLKLVFKASVMCRSSDPPRVHALLSPPDARRCRSAGAGGGRRWRRRAACGPGRSAGHLWPGSSCPRCTRSPAAAAARGRSRTGLRRGAQAGFRNSSKHFNLVYLEGIKGDSLDEDLSKLGCRHLNFPRREGAFCVWSSLTLWQIHAQTPHTLEKSS